jgi:hypothetical protein
MNERAFVVPIAADGTRLAPIEVGEATTPQNVTIPIAAALRAVLTSGCEAFELRHEHPSGDLRPSLADMTLTRHYLRAATWLGMTLTDHVIEGLDGELSMVAAKYLDPLPKQSLTAATPQE